MNPYLPINLQRIDNVPTDLYCAAVVNVEDGDDIYCDNQATCFEYCYDHAVEYAVIN